MEALVHQMNLEFSIKMDLIELMVLTILFLKTLIVG